MSQLPRVERSRFPPGESEGGRAHAGAGGAPAGRGRRRSRGGGDERVIAIRPDFHGLPDAGDGRLHSCGGDSEAAKAGRAGGDYCHDGRGDGRRPGALLGGGNGRLYREAGAAGRNDRSSKEVGAGGSPVREPAVGRILALNSFRSHPSTRIVAVNATRDRRPHPRRARRARNRPRACAVRTPAARRAAGP